MNWDVIKGKWSEMKGEIKAQWGKLTDDDLVEINGDREKLAGKLQQRYGWAKEENEKNIREYFRDKS